MAENPGVVLQNVDCTGIFAPDLEALANSTNHLRRNVEGMAMGDLNQDGFMDSVTVSSANYPEDVPLTRYKKSYGSLYDDYAFFINTFGDGRWNGYVLTDGTLAVEINSADNGNGWVGVKAVGTVGITSDGTVNRDGIGAVVTFTPVGGKSVMRPVVPRVRITMNEATQHRGGSWASPMVAS